MIPIRGSVKNYAWGKKGNDSLVARLSSSPSASSAANQNGETNKENLQIDASAPYAELWMGTHPSGPAQVVPLEKGPLVIAPRSTERSLAQLLETFPEYVGNLRVLQQWGRNLPFLFKILSVGQALSVQAHPDKKLAAALHAGDPKNYPDDNHKPEMAIALTPFEAMCGFRPLTEICHFMNGVPELATVVGDQMVKRFVADPNKESLRKCYTALMVADPDLVIEKLKSLVDRWSSATDPNVDEALVKLLLRLHSQYPGDIGCFSIFFLNYLVLQPGEALFLAANEPHAYLSGGEF